MPPKPKQSRAKKAVSKRATVKKTATSKRSKSTASMRSKSNRSRKTKVASGITADKIDTAQFGEWSRNVVHHLQTDKNLKSAADIYLMQRLFVVLDGDTSSWQAVDEKKNGRIFNLYNSNRGEMSTYMHRAPYRRQSSQMTRYVATDFRSLSYYTAINNDAKWIVDIPQLTFDAKAFFKNGKSIPVKTFVLDVLKAYFTTQKTNAKTLKASNDPSSDKDVAKHLEALLKSVQAIMGDDTVSVRFAYATFNPDRTPNRSAPLRLYVPAKKIDSTVGAYYIRERDTDTREVSYRKCKNKECDDRYLAVDVDDDNKIVADAFLSINEPEIAVKYHAVKQ